MPDAILIMHSYKGHTSDLPALISSKPNLKAYCTKEFPSLANSPAFMTIQPGQAFCAGLFSVQAILADHGEMPGCVINVINLRGTKIIAVWYFLSLPNADQDLICKPDLLILGTETYNDHPSTG